MPRSPGPGSPYHGRMLIPLAIALGALAGPGPEDAQEPVPRALRSAILESISSASAPMSFEVEERMYRVDLGCELGRQLVAHLNGRAPATEDSLADLVEFIEECTDTDDADAIAVEVPDSFRHYRTTGAGTRRLHEALDDEGQLVWAMLVDGDRQVRFEAEGGSLRVGPKEPVKRARNATMAGTREHMAPLPISGPWFQAMARTEWVARPSKSGKRVLAPLDRDGRRLDIALDYPVDAAEDSALLPHRVVATYYGVRTNGGEANLFAWSNAEGGPFLTDTLRITRGEDVIEVRHVTRSSPTFGVRPKEVRLVIPRPGAVEVASNAGWSSFRRREVLPKEWKDLVEIQR